MDIGYWVYPYPPDIRWILDTQYPIFWESGMGLDIEI